MVALCEKILYMFSSYYVIYLSSNNVKPLLET